MFDVGILQDRIVRSQLPSNNKLTAVIHKCIQNVTQVDYQDETDSNDRVA